LKRAELSEEVLDLRDENCPFTFIKTKLKLEEMDKTVLRVTFSDETTARDVARSVSSEGHEVLSLEKTEEGWTLVVRKRG